MRARLNCTELSEIAFRSSPGSTRLGITACMAGAKSALAVPATIEIAMMCQTAMCPLAVSTARVSAVAAITPSVPSMIVRRLARSAIAPPTSPRKRMGALPQKLTVPRSDARRVRS